MAKPQPVSNPIVPQKMDVSSDAAQVTIKTLHRETFSAKAQVAAPPVAVPQPSFSGTELGVHVAHERKEGKSDKDTPMTDPNPTPRASVDATAQTPSAPAKRGRKNGRFGKSEENAEKKVKEEAIRKSRWGRFLHEFKKANPNMNPLEATYEGRKRYVPENGKEKSYQKLWAEVWKTKNPGWRRFTDEERAIAMRQSFIESI